MGITVRAAKYLLMVKRKYGISFEKTATLGKQTFYVTMKKYQFLEKGSGDGFIKDYLGADIVHSWDMSDYEGATNIWDMNNCIPEEFAENYDVVIDGGTLEHVFEFTTALRNAMTMVKKGGYLIFLTMCNNHCGHGFYQFSPEIFMSTLIEKNGFKIKDMSYVERLNKEGSKYRARKINLPFPEEKRLEINTAYPSELYIVAEKTGDVPDSLYVQQSDYVVKWNGMKKTIKRKKSLFVKIAGILLPDNIKDLIKHKMEKERYYSYYSLDDISIVPKESI